MVSHGPVQTLSQNLLQLKVKGMLTATNEYRTLYALQLQLFEA